MASREEAVSPSGERRCRAAYNARPYVRCELMTTDRTTHEDQHRGYDPSVNADVRWPDKLAVAWQGCESTYTPEATRRVVECDDRVAHAGSHSGLYSPSGVQPWRITWSDGQADARKPCDTCRGMIAGRCLRCGRVKQPVFQDAGETVPATVVPARETQVGGEHYRRFGIQPWDIWQEYGLDAFTGTVVKYLLRAGRKGSKLEDLRKARHTLDRLIEIEEQKG